MGRCCLALATLVLLSVLPAAAQYSDVIAACRWDSKQLCAGALTNGVGLARCIDAHFEALGESCKAALVRIAAVREACAADIARQCPDIKPGAGRILLCVKANYAALSQSCHDAIGHAAERNLRAQ